MSSRFDLEEKVAIVAGGAGLLGSAISVGLADHGCRVVIADLDEDAGQAVSEEIGPKASYQCIDLSESDETDELAETVHDEYGRIDVLVNAAYPRSAEYGRQFEAVEVADWRRNVMAHLDSFFVPIKSVSPYMVDQGSGSITNLSSIYGIQAPDFTIYEGTDVTNPVEYSAAKGGIVNLTRYLASYLGPSGVRVNAVSPGGVFDEQPSRFVERYERRTPLGRMGEPDDVVGAVVFLSSDAGTYVTGHNLVVDGGWSIV